MKKTKKTYGNFYLSTEVVDRLREYCQKTGRVMGIFVERAIEEKLERENGC